MISIIALEELIKENNEKVSFLQKQLSEHEAGQIKLSKLSFVTTEAKLEEAKELLRKYKLMLEEIMQQEDFDKEEYEEQVKIKAAIERKKYFENQGSRIQETNHKPDEQKLEAMFILDELPVEIEFEDEELFEIALKSSELNLSIHQELYEKLSKISGEFKKLLKNARDENINELQMLNYRIPILVLHFSTLLEIILKAYEDKEDEEKEKDIKSNKDKTKEKKEKNKFPGLPKYEDWWIKELWNSHQAYFALYKWKQIISKFCRNVEQKKSWERIFDNWIFIKKLLSDKGELAFEYNFAFDILLFKYAQLEEELDIENLKSMDSIIKEITKKEDFTKVSDKHDIETPYSKFKIKRLES